MLLGTVAQLAYTCNFSDITVADPDTYRLTDMTRTLKLPAGWPVFIHGVSARIVSIVPLHTPDGLYILKIPLGALTQEDQSRFSMLPN